MNLSYEHEETIDERKVRESSVNRRRVRIEGERSESESKFTPEKRNQHMMMNAKQQ